MSSPTNPPAAASSEASVPAGSELESMFSEEHAYDEPEGGHHEEGGDEEDHAPMRKKRAPEKEHAVRELNLTAMMDMMTIILVFLLKNYATQPENVTLSEVLQPPKSTTDVKLEAALPITITRDAILVDNKDVVGIAEGKVAGETAGAGVMIDALKNVLDEQVDRLKVIEEGGGQKFEGKVLVVCDGSTPYALLMRVLYTAGQSDFTQYKLVTRARVEGEAVGTP
jgi:biopolymer transport protein ExbD